MKKKVKFLDSVAGLADPKPTTALDAKYKAIRDRMKQPSQGRPNGFSDQAIDAAIGEHKKLDRYGEPVLGFPRDWAFKPGDEVLINAQLAEKWEECGLCTILEEGKKAA